jgi:hypothetical protein
VRAAVRLGIKDLFPHSGLSLIGTAKFFHCCWHFFARANHQSDHTRARDRERRQANFPEACGGK